MWILIVALIALAAVAAMAGALRGRKMRQKVERGETIEKPVVVVPPVECCGQHEVCEKESLLAAVSKKIEYYDDEELDAYKGIGPEEYTDEQEEAFREVFYTMQDTDVAGWVRSLQLRGVALPESLKDEVFLIIGERRMTPIHNTPS
ncbi:MAG: phospholipase [Prevotellaceae bacterium]|nr:phospholipase [Prevotellaceae bacterium]